MQGNKLVEVLIRAKELLQIPGAWVSGWVFDNDPGGSNLQRNAPEARQYCVYGAVWKAAVEKGVELGGNSHHKLAFGRSPLGVIMEKAKKQMPNEKNFSNAADYNNQVGKDGAVKLLCAAIGIAVEESEDAEKSQGSLDKETIEG